jgi:4-methyl-5(b-hydroxyethyl)-thiazole monophosphate biosynthesis
MSKTVIFFADGVEECEGLLVADILRRAGGEVLIASISDSLDIVSSHSVRINCDVLAVDVDYDSVDLLVLPGGIPGTYNLADSRTVADAVTDFAAKGKKLSAICAAPWVLAKLGVLDGKKAISHKKFRDKLDGAIVTEREVVVDGNITTGWGLGAAIPFALELARQLEGEEAAEHVRAGIDYVH